jgi:cysteine-S-conjugate beta-lyase
MTNPTDDTPPRRPATDIVHRGRNPSAQHGFVNPPAYRGSTVMFPDLATLESGKQTYTYGRKGHPTMRALEEALCQLEGGTRTMLTSSGLAAVTAALFSFSKAGDHILVADTCYRPTRQFCDEVLTGLGVSVTFFDPLIGAGIAALFQPNTRVVYTESPGSQTFEVMDIPAIAAACRPREIWLLMDNTWATGRYFKPIRHGVDVSIQAGTKYIVGHADAMLGVVTANERAAKRLEKTTWLMGECAGSEEIYLGLRGLRTMAVLHPALPDFPGHALWKRDFEGASGLFAIVLTSASRTGLAALLDGMKLFGMGYSWGGYESLAVPFDPAHYRTATGSAFAGKSCLRLHVGLEDVEDLKVDLEAGFARFAKAA